MGQWMSKVFNNCFNMCKYTSCKSSCCDDNIDLEIKNGRKQKDTETHCSFCFGCCQYHNENFVHSEHKDK